MGEAHVSPMKTGNLILSEGEKQDYGYNCNLNRCLIYINKMIKGLKDILGNDMTVMITNWPFVQDFRGVLEEAVHWL